MDIEKHIKPALINLVNDLVAGNFEQIHRDGRIGRLTLPELLTAIDSYPGTLTHPSPGAFDDMDVYPVDSSETDEVVVEFDLWFDGRPSDLTLSATVQKQDDSEPLILIDDLHVL